jgi:cytochrome c553
MPSSSFPWVRLIGAVALLSLAGAAQADGDATRGAKLAYTCLGCHGIDNYKNVYPTYSVPRLRGQHQNYLIAALKAYKSQERSHATMHAQAVSLSEQDMQDVAAFLAGASLSSGAAPRGTPPAKVTEVCVACHGKDGVGLTADYPNLSARRLHQARAARLQAGQPQERDHAGVRRPALRCGHRRGRRLLFLAATRLADRAAARHGAGGALSATAGASTGSSARR